MRGQELADSSKTEWEQALKTGNAQKQSLVMLFRLAAQWHRVNDAEDLLWTIVNRYPQEKWATRTLTMALIEGGQTRSLMQLFSQELKTVSLGPGRQEQSGHDCLAPGCEGVET